MGGGARSKRGGARLSYSECCPLLAFFLRLIGVALIQSSATTTKCESLDPSDVRTSMGEESVVPVPSGGSHHQRLSDYVVKTGLHREFQHQAKSRDRLKRNIQKHTHNNTSVVSWWFLLLAGHNLPNAYCTKVRCSAATYSTELQRAAQLATRVRITPLSLHSSRHQTHSKKHNKKSGLGTSRPSSPCYCGLPPNV